MGRERLVAGTAGEFTYKTVVRNATKSVNGVETTVSKKVVVVRCRYRDPYGTYSQPQATGPSREAARRALIKRLSEMPVVAVTSLNLDSSFSALVDERVRQIDASDTLADSTKHQYKRTLNNVVRPAFGQLKIREVTTALLDNVVREWKVDGEQLAHTTHVSNSTPASSEPFSWAYWRSTPYVR
jgi:hypothetical protein